MNKLLIFALLVAAPALADDGVPQATVERSARFAGKNEISAQTGFQSSLGGTTPAGFKLFIDYSRRVSDLVWLNAKLNPTFAVGATAATCYTAADRPFDCGTALDGNGYALDTLVGVKLKWQVRRLRLMPYANVDAGVVSIFDRPSHDNGAAVVARTGGGVRYFITPHVAVGGELQLTLGPAFYSPSCPGCANGHNELYRAIDFAIGAEFIL